MSVLPQVDAAIASLRGESDHLRILTISSTATFTDRQAGCREALGRVVREVRQGSAVTPLITALEHLSLDAWMMGRWDQARELADTFRRLGAQPWHVRAGTELRATGLAARAADPVSPGISGVSVTQPLAPLDYEIARVAAAGLTNKQIGERLHLSHRTVAAHLYQIFPRLGITSRAALRDALDALEAPAGRTGSRTSR